MSHFLFLTHITPKSKRSILRQRLIDLYYHALEAQTCGDWTAVILGEEEGSRGRYEYFRLSDGMLGEKHAEVKAIFAGERFRQLSSETKYIIKLDDDDLISPFLLEKVAGMDVDLYYDEYHTFCDISSGTVTQQKRPWVASTCVHRKAHALAAWSGPGASEVGNLLYTDHSKSWHVYYDGKKKVAAPRQHPVYLRMLSPTSITSGALGGPVRSRADVSMEKYLGYLRSFGYWTPAPTGDFDSYKNMIRLAWEEFSGEKQQVLQGMGPSGWRKLLQLFRPE